MAAETHSVIYLLVCEEHHCRQIIQIMKKNPSGAQALSLVDHCYLLMLQRMSGPSDVLCFLHVENFLAETSPSLHHKPPTILYGLEMYTFRIFVFFSDRFCTRHCFVLSFVFTYGGAEDSSLQLP